VRKMENDELILASEGNQQSYDKEKRKKVVPLTWSDFLKEEKMLKFMNGIDGDYIFEKTFTIIKRTFDEFCFSWQFLLDYYEEKKGSADLVIIEEEDLLYPTEKVDSRKINEKVKSK
jgi:hypothetical protein